MSAVVCKQRTSTMALAAMVLRCHGASESSGRRFMSVLCRRSSFHHVYTSRSLLGLYDTVPPLYFSILRRTYVERSRKHPGRTATVLEGHSDAYM
ncbi:hypothetical protein B0H10DRAFT_548080 [Mycena sp. CBHHK59/15]|nr:hypothetical protein B0H10DRAFT_548080 [Mycena sp. CBHHK59/15]